MYRGVDRTAIFIIELPVLIPICEHVRMRLKANWLSRHGTGPIVEDK